MKANLDDNRDGEVVGVRKLDHVNIFTDKLGQTVEFYGRYLGLKSAPPPGASDVSAGAWLIDDRGQPIVHVITELFDPFAVGGEKARGGQPSVNHVAFECSNYNEALRRLTEDGIEVKVANADAMNLRFIFVYDPNGILCELNFRQG
jgi:catechol 2,3-dioxygenase-like lactoylglutathione lyase family enzyme